MDILTNLQEYGIMGAVSTIVLLILKYNGKQGWKERTGLSDRGKFFYLFLKALTITMIMQFTFLCLAYTNVLLMKKLKYVDDIQQPMIFVWNIIGVIVGLGICMIIEYRNIKKSFLFENKIMSIIAYIDIIIFVAALLFMRILDCAVINMICLLGFIVFFGVIFKVSGKKEYKHQYATIFLTNGEELQNIEVTTILTKWKWIACSDLDRNIEYRIRRRDIIRVKYYNK